MIEAALAKARWAARADRPRAIALAEAARDHFAADGDAESRAAAEAWLRARDRR